MFRAIVGAILFIEIGIPLILWIIGLMFENETCGCIIFGIAIIFLFVIFA